MAEKLSKMKSCDERVKRWEASANDSDVAFDRGPDGDCDIVRRVMLDVVLMEKHQTKY